LEISGKADMSPRPSESVEAAGAADCGAEVLVGEVSEWSVEPGKGEGEGEEGMFWMRLRRRGSRLGGCRRWEGA
jgi:hypothetical protein